MQQQEYEELVEPLRPAVLAHCYRMLGSFQDAEDALQESLLRAWRGIAGFEGRSSFRSWLYTIATNVCLTMIERRGSRRVHPVDFGPASEIGEHPGAPLVESVWIEPCPDDAAAGYEERESVELAFIAALQHLSPRQRAVLILCEVLGFSGAETAEVLETSPASVHSALQRARKGVAERTGGLSQQATLRSLGDARLGRMVERYVAAWESCDVDTIVSMLSADAVIAMPPRATWFRGRDAVGAFLRAWPLSPGTRWKLVPVRANGQLAFANYLWNPATGSYTAHAIDVLTLEDDRVAEITAFMVPQLFSRFDFPQEVLEGG
jgi:RNA polymerase sigma-70 factor, ECF subfamily